MRTSHYETIISLYNDPNFKDFHNYLHNLAGVNKDDGYRTVIRKIESVFLMGGVPEHLSVESLRQFIVYLAFERSGKKIYEITTDLSLLLKNTELKHVTGEMFELPYDSVYIQFPDNMFKMYNDIDNSDHWVYGVYVFKYNWEDCKDVAKHLYKDVLNPDDVEKVFRFMIVAKPLTSYHDKGDDALFHFSFPICKGDKDLCVSLQRIIDNFNSIGKPVAGIPVLEIFNFVLNSIMYITGADCDLKYIDTRNEFHNKVKRLQNKSKIRKLEKLNRLPRTIVGSSIVLSRHERQCYESHGGGYEVLVRTLVQGHWRNQAFGEKYSKRKHIFIRPFWRGPEFGEIVNKKHLVK